MKIALDIDNVLAETFKSFLEFYKDRFKEISLEDIQDEYFWTLISVSKGDFLYLFKDFYKQNKIDVVENSPKGMEYLSTKHELVFITSRSPELKEKTLVYLKNNFGITAPKILFSQYHGEDMMSKEEFCVLEKVDLLIEDSMFHSISCADKGILVFLLDRPWNKTASHERITRCKDWAEIIENVRRMEDGK